MNTNVMYLHYDSDKKHIYTMSICDFFITFASYKKDMTL